MQYLMTETILPDPQSFARDATGNGMIEVGKYSAALIGILIIILIFKAFWKS